MDRRQTLRFLVSTCVLLPLVLLLDRSGLAVQLSLGSAVALLLIWNVAPHRRLWLEVAIAIVFATTGEIVLSVVLGIYRYRSGGIPFFVPPGHGVIYLLAVLSAGQLERYRRAVIRTTFVAGSVAAVGMTFWFHDVFGLIGWIAILLVAARTGRTLLIATCVTFTTVLEIAGTTIGTWEWSVKVLGVLPQGNPPLGVAVFYCCLDVLTLAALNGLTRKRQNASCRSATSSDENSTSHGLQAA